MSAPEADDPVAVRLGELKSSRPHVRRDAARALASLKKPDGRVISRLIAALDDQDVSVRLEIAQALQRLGPAAVPALCEGLGEAEPDRRRAIVRTLGMIGPAARPALPALAELAEDPDLGPAVAQAVTDIRYGPPLDWNRILVRLSSWFLVGGALLEVGCLALHWAGLFADLSGVPLQISIAWAVLGAYFGAVVGAGLHGRVGVYVGANYLGVGGAVAGAFVGQLVGQVMGPLLRALGA